MRILLIQGYLGRREPPVMPMGLTVLAGQLRHHEVKIYDPNIRDNHQDEISGILDNFSPDLIGFSLRNIDTTKYSDQFLYFSHFRKYVNFVSQISGEAALVVGGAGFSLFPEQVMTSIPEIDFGFYLEGENSFKSFIDSQFKIKGITGIYYKSGTGIKFTGTPNLTEINRLPTPAWDLVDMAYYRNYTDKASIGVEAKRGCAMKCSYCTYPSLAGNRVRMKSPEKVVDEIELLAENHGVSRIAFTDPVFNYPLEHAENICREIIRRNINIEWTGYHQDNYLSAEYIQTALESGCAEFYISPDSASENGLKALGKSGTVGTLNNSLELIENNRKATVSYNFFAAIPGTGWHNFLAAIFFIIKAKMKLKQRLSRIKFSYIRIEPGTPAAKSLAGNKFKLMDSIPNDNRQLNNSFYRTSTSIFLNIILAFHYYTGKIFGRRNLILNP